MRKLAAPILLLLGFLSAGNARATVVEVQLPELNGLYWPHGAEPAGGKSATIQLPSKPSVIHGVSIRVRGTSTTGVWSCDSQTGPRDYTIGVNLSASMPAGADWWFTQGPGELGTGAFDWTSTFVPFHAPTWDFLLDGTGQINLGGQAESAIPECTLINNAASLTVSDVTLIVDGEFPTPANVSTWGRIKAQFR